MPITFTPVGGGTVFGWGDNLTLHTSFTGPFPTGTLWSVQLFTDSDRTIGFFEFSRVWSGNDQVVQLTVHNLGISFHTGSVNVGDTVFWDAKILQSGTTNVDESNGSLTWGQTSGWYPAYLQSVVPSGSGLTTTQAAQLAEAVSNTQTTLETSSGTTTVSIGEQLAAKAIDLLTTAEITSGPTAGPVTHNLTAWVQAVLVTISTIAPIDVGQTADEDYFMRALAVVRIFHGGNLAMRVPVHSSSRIVDLHTDRLDTIVTAVEVALWPPAVTLEVDFAAGVTGQVFLLAFP